MQRDDKIDIIKGLAICLMVLGHCGCPVTHFIYLFHMAVFFMASGYVYKLCYSESFAGLKILFFKRLKGLWLPFVLYNIIFSLLWNPLVKMHLYDAELISLSQYVKNLLMIFFMMGKAPMCGAFWFFFSLFYITIIYALVDYVLNQMNVSRKREVHLLFAFVLFLFIYFLVKFGFNSTTLSQLLGPYVVYAIGVDLASRNNWMIDKLNLSMVFVACFLILLVCNDSGSVGLGRANFTSPWFFIVASISGWFFLHSIASYMHGVNLLRRIFIFLGRNTICIVGLHFLAFKLITLIQIKIYNLPIESLNSFPVLHVCGVWWIVYFVIGITLPLMLNFAYKKMKNKMISIVKC